MKMNNIEKLQEIFKDIFDNDNLILLKEMTYHDIDDWDSLAQINIISACETTFGVKFDINEIVTIKSVGDILDLLEKKIKQ